MNSRLVAKNWGTMHLREERFMPDPIAPKRSFGGEYGWVSPFILEARNSLNLGKEQLPSRDAAIVPRIVEKAALGIMEEGKKLGESRAAEEMAQLLMKQKENGIKEVWKCCAHLYSKESFLYKTLNKAMRLIGSTEHEPIWRSKIHTLGPFCLLLWDNPFSEKPNTNKLVYRGANLTNDQIATYEDLSKRTDEHGSFQAFTSCSRNRQNAESMGNVLFIMKVQLAFTADLKPVSAFPDEEEELVSPGICFSVESVAYDKQTKKHLIYLTLKQRFSGE